jgi:hypothetical protein
MADLSQEVKSLLRERIASREQLEILLLVRREPLQSWTPKDVGLRLNMTPAQAGRALEHLCRGSLVDVRVGQRELRFRYSPATPDLERAVTELERVYGERPLDVRRML